MNYYVLASLAEDINSGWCWIKGSEVSNRSLVQIKNNTNGKSVVCEVLSIDLNFEKKYGDRDSIIESHRLASPGLRYLGQIIDGAISAAIFIFFLWLGTLIGLSQDSSGLIAFSAAAFYFLLSDGFAKGQSLGKKLLGISVIDSVTGKSCSFPRLCFLNQGTKSSAYDLIS
ncbi:RDD family protein [Vibrio parahaemolyticus]|nr:RDD family protein [Vibrio parahaemolyticus]